MFILYSWQADDEGGFDICDADEFTHNTGYAPESGWRARPSVKLGEFSNVNELADLLMSSEKECNDAYIKASRENTNSRIVYAPESAIVYNSFEYHLKDANEMMDCYLCRKYNLL